ncbi:MAG: enoyl-CoA hydratase-related protein [Bacillota bacterium]|nr:enoyl-CoA hydratase-related protein [Bacillota bacterium]
MQYEVILIEKNQGIGTITLNRPEQLNTFNVPLATELNQALLEMDADNDIRVIVIKGAGKGFCAGIDVNDLEGKTPLEYYEWISLMEGSAITISKIRKPVIASAHNIAVANGIGVVAAADLAIAAEGTRFGATAVNVGLFCMGPAVPLSKSLGRKKALELLLTGDLIDAEEAERIGLINKVVPKENLEAETLLLAQKLADKSPLAVQMGKKSFYEMSDCEYTKAFELVNNHFAMLCTSEDSHEGVNAFLEKRKPEWKMK